MVMAYRPRVAMYEEVRITVPDAEGVPWEYIAHFDFDPGEAASRRGHPDTWSPADPGYCDLVRLQVETVGGYREGSGDELDDWEAEHGRQAEEALREQMRDGGGW